MTELEQKAEEYKNKIEPCDMVYNDIVGMNECRFDLDQFKQAYKDGYEQGQKDKLTEKEKLVGTFINVDLEKENEELKKSVTEKNSKIEELKEELKNYAKVINELMVTRLDDTEEVGRLIEIAQYRNWSEL